MKRIIIVLMLFLVATYSAYAFTNEISYLGVNISLSDGTYNVTSKIFNQATGGSPVFSDMREVDVVNGYFGNYLNYTVSDKNATFWIEVEINAVNYTRFQYTPAAQCIVAEHAYNATLFSGYTTSGLPISGNVTGSLGVAKVTGLSLADITYSGLLGFNNLSKCSSGEILEMSGSVWTCGTDSTGSDTTCSDVACTVGADDTISGHALSEFVDNVGYYHTLENLTTNLNLSTLNGTNFVSVQCANIVFDNGVGSAGICDGSDASAAGGDKWILDTSLLYLYNDTTTAYFNETKLNATIDARDTDTIYANASFDLDDIPGNLSCEKINGTASNLCTITDTDTDTTYSNISFSLDNIPGNVSCQRINGTTSDLCTLIDTDTIYTLENITSLLNQSTTNGTNFVSVQCANIVFDNGVGSAGICDGDDSAGAGSYDLNVSGDRGSNEDITDSEILAFSGDIGIETVMSANTVTFNLTYLFLSNFTNDLGFITNDTMNKSASCANIYGSPDTDFCTDADTTYSNISFSLDNIPGNVSCQRVNGTASNLCTIVDTDTNTNVTVTSIQVTGTTTKTLNLEQSDSNLANETASWTDIDTNESTRFNALANDDCGSGYLMQGVNDTGGVLCVADQTTVGGGNSSQEIRDVINESIAYEYDNLWAYKSTLAVAADALSGNGANCAAGNYPLGVSDTGAVEDCTADVDTNITGCTDCIGVTEISDVYLLNSGDTSTGELTVQANITAYGQRLLNNTGANEELYEEYWNGTCVVKVFNWGARDAWCP